MKNTPPHSTGSMTSIKQALSTEICRFVPFRHIPLYGLDARLSLIVYVGGHDDTLHAFTDQAIATTIVVQNMTILLICCLSASIASGAFGDITSGTRKETSVCKWVRPIWYGSRICVRTEGTPYVFPTRKMTSSTAAQFRDASEYILVLVCHLIKRDARYMLPLTALVTFAVNEAFISRGVDRLAEQYSGYTAAPCVPPTDNNPI
jgi:hypothetical protein